MALVGWWPLDGNTDDYSVNNNTGVNTNVTFVNGKIGQAGSFNGTSSNIPIPNVSTYKPTGTFSISLWVNPANSSGTRYMFLSGRDLNNSGIGIYQVGTTHNFFAWINGTIRVLTYGVSHSVWTHVVCLYDQNVGMKVYVNGSLTVSNTFTGTIAYTQMYGNSPSIGSHGGLYFYQGLINDFRFFDHALSQKEINELAKARVLHYTFNKDEGSIVYDNSGLKRNATVNGATWTDQGYSFNGSTNSIERPMIDSLGINSFTINMWAYFEQTNARDIILGTFNGSNPLSFNFEKNTLNRLRFYWQGIPDISSANDVVPIQQRCMLTLVRDKEQGRIKMYVNGQNVVNQIATASDITSFDNRTLFIGRDIRTTSEATNGKLDDIVFYTTALSDADILDMYQTRAKIDNQGNLYANEFVEDYEVAPGLTLAQLFENKEDGIISINTSAQYSAWNTINPNGKTYYVRLKWVQKPANNFNSLNFESYTPYMYKSTITTTVEENSDVIVHTSHTVFRTLLYNQNSNQITGSFYWLRLDMTDIISSLGYTPTKAQMDSFYRDYSQSRTKSNGQIITSEFNEVGIDTIAVNGLTYRQIFENNNLNTVPEFDTIGNWTTSGAGEIVSVSNSIINVSFSGPSSAGGILQPITASINDKIYMASRFKTNGISSFLALNSAGGNILSNSFTNTEFQINSALLTVVNSTSLRLYLRGLINHNNFYDNLFAINTTSVFGSGNEPTQAQMDQLYTEYRQLKTEEQALRIFKDKIHIQGSLNEGGQ
jgi:hypothetical protein